jgi:transposase-like protein
MMAVRGLFLAHTTIIRWIQRYVPEFEKRWNRFARQAGGSWRVDETYVKIKGHWTVSVVRVFGTFGGLK